MDGKESGGGESERRFHLIVLRCRVLFRPLKPAGSGAQGRDPSSLRR
jgi:hypothetical protein